MSERTPVQIRRSLRDMIRGIAAIERTSMTKIVELALRQFITGYLKRKPEMRALIRELNLEDPAEPAKRR